MSVARDRAGADPERKRITALALCYELAESLNATGNYLAVAMEIADRAGGAAPKDVTRAIDKGLREYARACDAFRRLQRKLRGPTAPAVRPARQGKRK